jgi:hypothetical protein
MRRRLLLRITRGHWWLLRSTRAEVQEAITNTCRMALARLTSLPDGYQIHVGRESFALTLVQRGNAVGLRFKGLGQAGKKGILIRKLLSKQFDPVIPRLKIKLRRVR